MPYVVRNTLDPEYDIRRDWSAWMGHMYDSEYQAMDYCIPGHAEISRDLVRAVDADWDIFREPGRDLNDLWNYCAIEDRAEFERIVVEHAEDCDLYLRFHEGASKWMLVHHEGLSCWDLCVDDEEVDDVEAIQIAQSILEEKPQEAFPWYGFGQSTRGKVRHVAKLDQHLHVFWSEDTCSESGM